MFQTLAWAQASPVHYRRLESESADGRSVYTAQIKFLQETTEERLNIIFPKYVLSLSEYEKPGN